MVESVDWREQTSGRLTSLEQAIGTVGMLGIRNDQELGNVVAESQLTGMVSLGVTITFLAVQCNMDVEEAWAALQTVMEGLQNDNPEGVTGLTVAQVLLDLVNEHRSQ